MRWFDSLVIHLEETVPALCMAVMIVAVALDVCGRYLFNHPLLWAGELATSLFIWATFLAAAGGLRRGLHVGVNFIVERFPVRVRAGINLVMYLLMSAMLIILVYMGWGYAMQAHFKMLQTLGISYTYVNMAVPVGCGLMAYHLLFMMGNVLRGVIYSVYDEGRIGFEGTGAIMPEESRE